MRPEVLFFEVSAFIALVLLVRHEMRTTSVRDGLVLVLYLTGLSIIREVIVYSICAHNHTPLPYISEGRMGQLGPVNVVVATGWIFTTICSFNLAKLIQRTGAPGSNIFLTLALTALVTTAISYAVETTGTRVRLWTWTSHGDDVSWLPFEWPFDAFDGWAATSFMIMFLYCGLRYRLLSEVPWRSAALVVGAFVLYVVADFAMGWFGGNSPRKVLTLIYIAGAVVLGFRASPRLLGTSDRELAPPRPPR